MGGFSSQVQQGQTSQPSSGKGGVGAIAEQQVVPVQPNQTAQPMPEMTFQPAVMPPSGGGKGSVGQTAPNTVNPQPAPYTPFRDDTNYATPNNTMRGKGSSTNSATSGQPRMGQPNRYANTIPQWDNASQQLGPAQSSGKGKGG